MAKRVLIIGGYGNFGRFISKKLAEEKNIQIIIAGRSIKKAEKILSEINTVNKAEIACLDINRNFPDKIKEISPDIVIHTSGPFQSQDYKVAQICIEEGVHYIDLADGRDFVTGVSKLDYLAKERGVMVISGASSVPCLSSALVDYYKDEFEELQSLDYGITTAQKITPGIATVEAILSYTGKPFMTLRCSEKTDIYGWQDLHIRRYKWLGWRLLGNCDIPDLSLFPKCYPDLKTIRFYAGLEIFLVHISLWLLSWLVRVRLVKNLKKFAGLLLNISSRLNFFGSSNSAFHLILSGKSKDGKNKTIKFELIALSGDGLYIPCVPAILLTKKIIYNEISYKGASPCMGFITRDEYLNFLQGLDISWVTESYLDKNNKTR